VGKLTFGRYLKILNFLLFVFLCWQLGAVGEIFYLLICGYSCKLNVTVFCCEVVDLLLAFLILYETLLIICLDTVSVDINKNKLSML
jgi:hypothetical protein